MSLVKKLSWQERVVLTEQYHKEKLRINPKHRLEDTAKELNRAEGRISEDLMLADWMKTHPKVERFRHCKDALEFIRAKKLERKLA